MGGEKKIKEKDKELVKEGFLRALIQKG